MMYARRDTEELGDLYISHVDAMTSERLHDKADIAAELAYRDAMIAKMKTAIRLALCCRADMKSCRLILSEALNGPAEEEESK